MARVTGIGGAFFKADDPVALAQWYEKHLGITLMGERFALLQRKDDPRAADGATVFAVFPRDDDYFKTNVVRNNSTEA